MANKFLTKLISAGCLFSVMMTSSVFASNLAKVTGDSVNLRSYNSTQGRVVGTVAKDETLTIVSNANNGWFQVKKNSGVSGFIASDFIQITQTDATCIATDVNVRTAPSTSATILGKANKGQVFVTSGKAGDFYAIKYNNTTGYIHKDYMQGSLLLLLPTLNVQAPATSTTAKANVNTTSGSVYAVVDASSLNLRKAPTTEGQPIKALPEGYNLSVEGYAGDWIKVTDDTGTTGYVSAEYVTLKNGDKPENIVKKPTLATPANNKVSYSGNVSGSSIIEFGKQYIGTPYVWAGTDLETGVDCSGFVYSCYKNFGINLLRTSRDMYTQGSSVDRDSLEPGDLVFFNSGGDSQISHVGMYVGDDEYIHSTNGAANGVTISELTSSYAEKTYVGARRILNN
ncbi:MAG: SH3 domain-containing protein [Lachnospirales bacterium]